MQLAASGGQVCGATNWAESGRQIVQRHSRANRCALRAAAWVAAGGGGALQRGVQLKSGRLLFRLVRRPRASSARLALFAAELSSRRRGCGAEEICARDEERVFCCKPFD